MNEANDNSDALHSTPLKRGRGEAVRLVIAGGGTGGHIFPAIAIANALKKIDSTIEILFIGAKGKMEMEKVPQAGYEIVGLDIAGFNRSSLIKNIGLPMKLLKSFLQVRSIFKRFNPHAAIGVGGYSSFPVLRFAQARGVPSFIHESNSFAGKTNIILGRKATKIFVASDGMENFFPSKKILVTGNPVRTDVAHVAKVWKDEALLFFGLQPGRQTVLIVGGSLGARSINDAIEKGIEELIDAGLQIIWQTGKTEADRWKAVANGKKGIWVADFIKEMQYAYAAADIVISRAGAIAIAELCVVQKPVVFVPYPFAAEDHQTVNAQNLMQKNAALMVKDSEAKEKVVSTIIALAKNDEKQIELKQNIARLAIIDADKKVAEEILKTITK
jgi:UDP-N-acetylglucosamine--N-acetylmuramyl-(pentapeptide) pyrophosphoryl-undecaprenol N-acetylglucosamine transferase